MYSRGDQRAKQHWLAGRIWPTGRLLRTPTLTCCDGVFFEGFIFILEYKRDIGRDLDNIEKERCIDKIVVFILDRFLSDKSKLSVGLWTVHPKGALAYAGFHATGVLQGAE